MKNAMNSRKINILGIDLDNLPSAELFDIWLSRIKQKNNSSYGCFCEANLCVCANHDRKIRELLAAADFIMPDGISMTAGARLLGMRFAERQPGPDTLIAFCRFGATHHIRHFFYGGRDEQAMKKLLVALKEKIPHIEIAGWYVPPFRPLSEEEDDALVDQINESQADVVWVGLGAPKQEIWMNERKSRLQAPLLFGVGAAFDFLAGTRKRAPRWIRQTGGEWIYRMLTGGKRVFWRNLKQESTFVLLIALQAAKKIAGTGGKK